MESQSDPDQELSMVDRVVMAIAETDGVMYSYRDMALAILQELREPTKTMMLAGGLKAEAMMFEDDPDCTGVIFKDMGTIFRTMIDIALKEH